MESKSDGTPLIALVGETASGKSVLAHALAKRFSGEIIAADSRTVYKGMDIGTAKPTPKEQAELRYHLLDITTPNKPITAAIFKRLANEAIYDVTSRGKLPFLVGGSGLYIDAVLYDFSFAPRPSEAERAKWQFFSIDELHAELMRRGIPLPANPKNPRHLMRQLETGGIRQQPRKLRPNTLVLGMSIDRPSLERRISQRIDHMFSKGLMQEVAHLSRQYSWSTPPMQTIGYQEFSTLESGAQTVEEVKTEIKKHTLQYAKRQRTWFGRNKSIQWIATEEEAVDLITTFLNK